MKLLRRRPWACLTIGIGIALGGANFASGTSASKHQEVASWSKPQGDLSVMTYNVKGLPEPIVPGRREMLERIGVRLAAMRSAGRQPSIVVLQEAFTADARRIAELAGYAYVLPGPARADTNEVTGATARPRSWLLGETLAPQLDSGLLMLSDFPIVAASRAAFPRSACAGFDCLANKGVLVAIVNVPGKGPVAVAATHLNSRGASGAPEPHTQMAYGDQIKFMASLLSRFRARKGAGDLPLIVAGDFNQGQRKFRTKVLRAALTQIAKGPVAESLSFSLNHGLVEAGDADDAVWIAHHARDMQFVVPGRKAAVVPLATSVPFGREADGGSLSDHYGFVVSYAIEEFEASSFARFASTR